MFDIFLFLSTIGEVLVKFVMWFGKFIEKIIK